jgi:hypothetical protein
MVWKASLNDGPIRKNYGNPTIFGMFNACGTFWVLRRVGGHVSLLEH